MQYYSLRTTTCFEYMQPLFTFHQLTSSLTRKLWHFLPKPVSNATLKVQQLLSCFFQRVWKVDEKTDCQACFPWRHFFFFFFHPLLCDLSIIPRLFTNCQLACQDRNYSPNRWLNPHDFSWAKRRLSKAKLSEAFEDFPT